MEVHCARLVCCSGSRRVVVRTAAAAAARVEADSRHTWRTMAAALRLRRAATGPAEQVERKDIRTRRASSRDTAPGEWGERRRAGGLEAWSRAALGNGRGGVVWRRRREVASE